MVDSLRVNNFMPLQMNYGPNQMQLGVMGTNQTPLLINSVTPFPQNQMPLAFNMPMLGAMPTSSGGTSGLSTEEKVDKLFKLEKEQEALKTEKAEAEKALADCKSVKKKDDGTVVKETSIKEYKKLPWWKRALRAVGNLASGVLDIGTKFIGLENGKWNWKKCLKNVAIAVGTVALTCIPVVGPFISAGLLATGVVTGGVAVGRGISKACKAQTVEELDQAYQDIGGGAFIGVSSALGLRGMGKALSTGASASQASVATTRTSTLGKAWQNVSQFGRDMTVNAFRQARVTSSTQSAAISAAKATMTGKHTGLRAFGQVYKQNVQNMFPTVGEKKFQQSKESTLKDIDARINEISTNPTKLQKQELKMLKDLKADINNCLTKKDWVKLQKESRVHEQIKTLRKEIAKMESKGSTVISGKKFSKNNSDDVAALKNYLKRAESYSKELEALAKVRQSTMQQMSLRPNKNKAQLDAYIESSKNTGVGYLWNTSNVTWKTPFSLAWKGMSLPYTFGEKIARGDAGGIYKIQEAITPSYVEHTFANLVEGFGVDLGSSKVFSEEEYNQILAQTEAANKDLASKEKSIEKQIDSTKKSLGMA